MSTLLKIDSSPRGDQSISRQLGKQFADEWQQSHSGATVIQRDLATTSLPFVDTQWIASAYTPKDKHTEEHKAALSISDELIGELEAADQETPYLRNILGFMGITDVTFVRAGGTSGIAQGKVSLGDFLAPFQSEVRSAASVS